MKIQEKVPISGKNFRIQIIEHLLLSNEKYQDYKHSMKPINKNKQHLIKSIARKKQR